MDESRIKGYVKMWPRLLFYLKPGEHRDILKSCLDTSGVYVLYSNSEPFYFGQAADSLFKRLEFWAQKRYTRWDHFSAFVMAEKYVDDFEGTLICATPLAANKQEPKFKKVNLPNELNQVVQKLREIDADALPSGKK
jgi:hypothetical protein